MIDHHGGGINELVPEILTIRLIGIDTAPRLIADAWVDNQLRALLADHNFKVICDVAVLPGGAPEEIYTARCWLLEDVTPHDGAESWVANNVGEELNGQRDLSQTLLATGVVVRAPLKSLEEEQDRLMFDREDQDITIDQHYQQAERQARQAKLGVWRDYQPNLKTERPL